MHFGNCEGCGAPVMFKLTSVSLKNYNLKITLKEKKCLSTQ